ncbi:MAG: hypothetical protein GX605_09575 [Chloroflexi bacterium]|nr:hypothetical protein [Chloroflexota bacterium]
MIFVTVGTTEFDGLVRAMDELAPSLGQPVVMQIGHGAYEPHQAQFFRFAGSLAPHLAQADLVVAHGGLGTTMEVLYLGKPLVSVSNPDRYDRHQEDLLGTMEGLGHLLWCRRLEGLGQAIAEAGQRTFVPYQPPPCTIHEVIGDHLRRWQEKEKSV